MGRRGKASRCALEAFLGAVGLTFACSMAPNGVLNIISYSFPFISLGSRLHQVVSDTDLGRTLLATSLATLLGAPLFVTPGDVAGVDLTQLVPEKATCVARK